MKRPQTLDKILNNANSELEVLVTHARQLRRLQAKYQDTVSENLANKCQVANFRNGILTLSCQSSAWATRAKMEKIQILDALRKSEAFPYLEEIEFLTRPAPQPSDYKENFVDIAMSSESAKAITAMANSLEDPDLREALLRLSKRQNE